MVAVLQALEVQGVMTLALRAKVRATKVEPPKVTKLQCNPVTYGKFYFRTFGASDGATNNKRVCLEHSYWPHQMTFYFKKG